ncbi:MAG TPA: zinc transporter ZupT [Chitinispirillaceae bacterium]|nr:zinc transporter ZupT [Chitinispirillaceae bacterium]
MDIIDLSTGNILLAFSLTLLAGLSTGIGSAIAFFTKHTNTRFLSFTLGFSAGVMIYVSFVEIFTKARESLILEMGPKNGNILTVCAFFGGILLIALIDKLVPGFENPHEMHKVEELNKIPPDIQNRDSRLLRTGVFTAIAIAIHNFPEGLATFTAALSDPALGISIAAAIAIHNIPEGIAVSIPVYYATKSRKKAFFYSFISGLAEPLGALLGFAIFFTFFSEIMFGVIFAIVAGIMVFISLDELLPSAQKYGEHHLSIYGLIIGMAIMAASLILLM